MQKNELSKAERASKRTLRATWISGVEAQEPDENPTHAQGHMGRHWKREPGKWGRKATKRKAPDENRALPSSITPSKCPQKQSKKNGNTKMACIARDGGVSVYIQNVRLHELKLPCTNHIVLMSLSTICVVIVFRRCVVPRGLPRVCHYSP